MVKHSQKYPYYDNTDSNSTDEIYEKGVRPDVSQDSGVQVSHLIITGCMGTVNLEFLFPVYRKWRHMHKRHRR